MENLIIIELEEPNIALLAEDYSPSFLKLSADKEIALLRYKALINVMISQLVGLVNCHIRFIVTPLDALEAVKFWLLTEFRGEIIMSDHSEDLYKFIPEQYADAITLEFCSEIGNTSAFQKIASFNPYCVFCGARWINLAFQQSSDGVLVVGDDYLIVEFSRSVSPVDSLQLPALEIVNSEAAWESALDTHLSGKLMKQLEKVSANHC